MVLDIFISIFTEVIKEPIMEFIVVPIKRHISYPFIYKSKVETLRSEAEQLKNKRLNLQQSVDEATRKGEEIYESVNKWMIDAGKAIEEAEEFIQGEEQAKKRCFVGLCPDLKTRYLLSKKAEKKALAIDKLRNEGDLDSISFRPRLLQIVASSVYNREALNSRVLFLKQVMDALRDPNLNMIGVYGMGGVGKTTLAKEVHRQAIEEKLFDVVVMVAVNQTPELRRIQSEIADVLGLTFDVEEIPGRANRLYERLKKEEKVLIILDDIWKQLDLKAVGIPFGDVCRGCKILLTSRSQDVLSREMRTQKEFRLDVLQDEEAWSLFEMTLTDAKDSELPPIAAEVAKKCAGLPLLLLTVATDLRNRESYAWNDKLNQLSVFDNEEIYAKVHSVLESSYNDLPGNEVKSFFLFCGLLGLSNIPIRSLLKYVMGLSLFKHISSVKEARNKVYTLIDTLKAKCLLIDGDKYGFVKIHDVVRDTALSIASREQHAFIGTSGSELMEWPNKDSARISLPYCDIEDLPEGWECPKAELLLLFTEVLSLGIPDLFFKGIRNLEVVDFTGMRFVSLPSSLAFLSNLHTLCLHRCQLDDIAIIGVLKQLRVLSFANSYIVELPGQIEHLTRLKLLDVSDCSKLKMIPANALSKLSQLEALYMSNSFDRWEADGIRNQGNASLAELEYLSHLMTLEIQILDANILPKHLFSNGLQSYRILIGDGWDWNGNYETSRMLKLKLKTSIHSEYGVKVLLRETEDLYLDEVRGAENVLYDIDGDGFPQLKHLHVQNNTVIQHIINSTKCAACDAFPILESLILEDLMNLEKICHGQLAAGSFNKLEILEVRNCDRLTNLFSLSTARCLLQLRVMEVYFCPNMEAIVIDEDQNSNEEVVEFNQLRSLYLYRLPHLRSFRSKMKKAPPGIESRHKQILTADEPAFEEFLSEELSLLNRMVSFPNLEDLHVNSVTCEKIWHDQLSATYSNLKSLIVHGCNNLKYLFTTSIVKSLLHLKKLQIGECRSMKEIILTEESIEEQEEKDERMNKILFPKLDGLGLRHLPNLIRFCSGYQIEFQSLRDLGIEGCGALMCLVPSVPHTDMMAKQVYTETNHNTEIQSLFNEMVTFSNLEKLSLSKIYEMKSIWHSQFAADSFCKLKSLGIYNCSKLMTVFPSNVLERFQRLEELSVRNCNSLQEIYQLEGSNVIEAFELRKLSIGSLPSLKHVWRKDPQGVFTFQNLKSVEVSNCDVLKNLFPASVAEGLLQLEKLTIIECGVEEIVAKPEDVEPAPYYCFKFPQLTSLELIELSELRSFYPGTHISEWQKLKSLNVRNCRKVMKFGWEEVHKEGQHNIPIQQPPLLLDKMSPNLEELTLEHKDLIAIQHGQFSFKRFSKLKVLTLSNLQNRSQLFLIGFLKTVHYVETIVVESSNLEESFSCEGFTLVRNLKLFTVDNLKQIWDQDSRLKPILQHLETLSVIHCNSLINIVPSSSPFLNLATLEVSCCEGLVNLITASTAKTMVQLTKMTVHSCNEMTEIVTSDGDDHTEDEIIFSKLQILELTYLSSLISFCSGNHAFNFPSLENVKVNKCLQMKIFSFGVLNTPKLRGIELANQQHWEGNLNATIESSLSMTYFQASKFPELWHGGIQGRLFHNVQSLTVDQCAISDIPVPANLLQFLNKLEKLQVEYCDSAEIVFDLEGLSVDDGHTELLPQLSKLHLANLPMLRHLWNKDPLGILEFNNLRLLHVENCNSLKNIFTWSTALCLMQLEEIKLSNCNTIEEIIEKEGPEEATSSADKMILPSLKFVDLECLPKFSSFYSGSSNLECLSLKKLSIYECPSMKNVFGTLVRLHRPNTNDEGREQRLDNDGFDTPLTTPFCHKMFPNLEELSLDKKSAITILQSQFPTDFFSQVKVLQLRCFPNKSLVPLFSLLPGFPNLQNLVVLDSSLKQLFPFEGFVGDQEDITALPRIRALKLKNLDDLKHVWESDCQLHNPLFQSLEDLEIESCGNLIFLVPSSASFRNLKALKVSECNALINIVTSSTAKSMVQLETLTVKSCNMLTEIVGGDQGVGIGSTDEIVFSKMKTLQLEDLQSLTSFCLGSYTFNFPSLEQLTVHKCPKLRIFTAGVSSTPKLGKLGGVWTSWQLDRKMHWEGNLNATIEQLYMKCVAFEGIYDVQLSNFPMLKEKWHGQFPFKNLKHLRKLVVDDCAFFSNAVSSNLLKYLFLSKMKNELVVERCDSVEELFDLEGLNADEGDVGLLNYLNELRLIDLPRLRHVWNDDPQGILRFKNLTLLQVQNCSSLTNMFTLSMASGLVNLQHMELKRCILVEHIITKEADEEVVKDKIMFPSMKSIGLECLPNLSSFYSARDFLKCPSLKRIDMVGCPNMELLASKFCEDQDLSMIAEGNEEGIHNGDFVFSIAASSGGKVAIPSLEELRVEYNTMKDMWSQADFLSGLKGIELTCFSNDSTLLPSYFFQILPDLEKLVLSDASFEEIIFHEEIISEETRAGLIKLKELKLSKLPRIKHLMDAKLLTVFQCLETLEVLECGRLEILVPSSVSLQNLKTLEVSNCQRLVNLISSSTARSLERLRKMKIEKCELIQEIIVTEADKDEEEEICFGHLKCLELQHLPSLSSFCSGNSTFSFPSLEEVIIIECPNMKIFAQEVLSAPKLWRVQTGEPKYTREWEWKRFSDKKYICEWEWEGSLNNTIEALFKEMAEETGIGQCSYAKA
ncbi:uncharacterized protein LOC110661427 isoform X2 [Hevea brasiliensis]|uniref:uncharacterized protein LOC110661427 isoform X2 n=1 Tax=Hevea brasiliensis TaxID=3981 RepID=UPI0025DC0B6E|nr:uncharacterized protein LOC110661427 isoform X2 [Hevea brasiliensis]XP_058007429.1 uncharacterized protein LOC110661427 isoform X2 [Hevea brasiliensis]XP_058007430.1 uncharacterized protein LOC110661427 isoform X2 [Hevea brasiliensis]